MASLNNQNHNGSSGVVCPGSCEENYHTLQIISPETGNLFCRNNKCFFIYMDSDKNQYWEYGFDPLNTMTFIKNESKIIFKNKGIQLSSSSLAKAE